MPGLNIGYARVSTDQQDLTAERLEAVALSGEVLLVGADAGVADLQTRRRGSMP